MRRIALPLLAATLSIGAGVAPAQNVSLALTVEDENLRGVLEAASLTLSIDPTAEGTVAQDYVAAARADYLRLLTALYAEGHYGGRISILVDGREASGIAPLDAPSRINTVVLNVDPGPQFAFGTARIGPLAPGSTATPEFRTGEPARANVIRDAARQGVTGWREVGYPLAEPGAQDIVAVHPERRLDASVEIRPGQQLRFGNLTVTGNQAVRAERIAAIAGLPTGEVYTPAAIDAAAQRLRRTGAFDSVALIEADSAGPGQTLPVEAQVDEALPRRLGFGAEIATEEGLTLSAYWMHRNLLGGAERLRLDAEASGIGGDTGGIDYSLGAAFSRPATIRADIDLVVDTTLKVTDELNYQLDVFEASVGLNRMVNEEFSYGGGLGLLVARETTPWRTRDYTLLTLPLDATLDRRNDPFDATSGYYFNLDITPFFDMAEGGTGVRVYGDARAYLSFGESDRVTLAARGQIGSVTGTGLLDVPADFLFYSGGGGTVRGQPYNSLGLSFERDFGAGEVPVNTGGASFLGAQLETRVRVTDKIGAVGFLDVGMIGADAIPDSTSDWHAGAGLGVRYGTPIGPIRLDIATPVTGDDAGRSVQVYVGIGQSF